MRSTIRPSLPAIKHDSYDGIGASHMRHNCVQVIRSIDVLASQTQLVGGTSSELFVWLLIKTWMIDSPIDVLSDSCSKRHVRMAHTWAEPRRVSNGQRINVFIALY